MLDGIYYVIWKDGKCEQYTLNQGIPFSDDYIGLQLCCVKAEVKKEDDRFCSLIHKVRRGILSNIWEILPYEKVNKEFLLQLTLEGFI